MTHRIYFQPQQGGNCRLHSLNGYYGKDEISVTEFKSFCSAYDNKYKGMGLPAVSDWDAVVSNQENLVSFILAEKSNLGTFYIPPGYVQKTLDLWGKQRITQFIDRRESSCFVFNRGHIWIIKNIDDAWYKIDSIGGVSPCNPNSLMHDKTLGFMPIMSARSMRVANQQIVKRIKATITRDAVRQGDTGRFGKQSIQAFIADEIKEKRYLSKFEIDLSMFYKFYNLLNPNHISHKTFIDFFVEYQTHPANEENLKQRIPALLHFICVQDE